MCPLPLNQLLCSELLETNLYQLFCGLGRRVANDVNIDEYTL